MRDKFFGFSCVTDRSSPFIKATQFIKFATQLLFVLLISGCSGSSGDSDSDTSADGEVPIGDVSFTSLCGVVSGDEILNPVQEGEQVVVDVISSDQVAVLPVGETDESKRILIKLHGVTAVGVNEFRRRNGVAILERELSAGAVLVRAGRDCEFTTNGQAVGILGQIFSLSGRNMSELLLESGAVVPVADICMGDVLASCYQTIGVISRPPTDVELDFVSVNLTSKCGAAKEGVLVNPVTAAEQVAVDVISADQVEITRIRGIEAGKQQLVKLHGISTAGVPAFRASQGASFLRSETSAGAYLVVQSQSCSANTVSGGAGVFGQLYSLSGESLNESLISLGSVVSVRDACNGELINACYNQLQLTAPPPPDDTASDEVIDDFLWKPVSESTGNLAILVNPENVRVVVTGNGITETLNDTGPSNGRGTTARGVRPGCAFGNNAKVEFFDEQGRRIFIADGRDSVSIPRGCDRLEFKL